MPCALREVTDFLTAQTFTFTVVSNLTKPRKIELNLGNPKNGWLPIELKSANFELEFIASNIPEIPTDKLCESLILALNGIETEICWNLEPECYFIELKSSGKEIDKADWKKIDQMKLNKLTELILDKKNG